jgi:hypothetical protein
MAARPLIVVLLIAIPLIAITVIAVPPIAVPLIAVSVIAIPLIAIPVIAVPLITVPPIAARTPQGGCAYGERVRYDSGLSGLCRVSSSMMKEMTIIAPVQVQAIVMLPASTAT